MLPEIEPEAATCHNGGLLAVDKFEFYDLPII